ncbi:DUF1120 domain-containing protein [Herbaspirillum lusitanum]|jgi:hypothetical protein|uniref:DUF1120 domain-containing protein n=1 Tax=Herbaspirillum lusitanum TaxID=213312 RepID=A0ABW9AC54_9BURK
MKKVIALSALLATALFSHLAHAADTAELQVKGVIKPAACKPTFTGGGVVDYGVIPASRLTAGAYTRLEKKDVTLNVSCDAAAKIALVTTDNRAASKVAGITESIRGGAEYNYGLGTVAGKNVGGYTLSIAPETTADSKPVTNLYAKGNAWADDTTYIENTGTLFSFAAPGTKTPLAIKQLSARITVETILNKPENLPLTQEVPFDGSTTIEIKYL